METGISRPVNRDDPEPVSPSQGRRNGSSFELALRSGVIQGEFSHAPLPVKPLAPYFKFVGIPETSGSERAPSKHFHFRLDLYRFSSLEKAADGRVPDVNDQPVELDDDSFSGDILPRDEGDGL